MINARHFTDPACPWDFSSEPRQLRLRWLYGDALRIEHRAVVLSRSGDEYTARGFGPKERADSAAWFAARFGMPIYPVVFDRMPATVVACTAFVAARLHAPDRYSHLLRALRVRYLSYGELLDEPDTIAAAADDAGLLPADLVRWMSDPDVLAAVEVDAAVTRNPSAAAIALSNRLARAGDGWRYTAPSYELASVPGGQTIAAPGFQAVDAYEVAIANLDPDMARRADPSTSPRSSNGHPSPWRRSSSVES